jgi:putative transposase
LHSKFSVGYSIVQTPSRKPERIRIGRHTPAKGIVLSSDMPLILWCTICTHDRIPWLLQSVVMRTLHACWSHPSNAWLVGDYLIMPDHVHFFTCPRRASDDVDIERWAAFSKDAFSKLVDNLSWRWQRGIFHTRMRSDQHYQEKRDYMRDNPVTAGLITNPDAWPWHGRIHDLHAHIRSFGNPPS